MTEPTQGGTGHPHPPDWSSSDSVLESEIRQDERRILADERKIHVNRVLVLSALGLLALTVTALILSIIALNRDIDAVAKATPKDNSVSTSSIQDGAVTAVKVANNSLTGVQINEASLAQVPAAAKAGTANNATQLGGTAADAYVHGVKIAQTATDTTSATLKGPTVATCPSGTRVIGGGAEVAGARNVAIIESAPSGTSGWTAIAGLQTGSAPSWRLTVYAICAAGGS